MNLPAKTIAIMGATGLQGGAVLEAFHELKLNGNNEEQYFIRGITRDSTSPKAEKVKHLVDEIFQADADDEESMVKAFDGCYGAFIVTNYFEDFDTRHEIKTTKNIQVAAKKAGLKHVVLSTLDDTRKIIEKSDNKDSWKVLDEEMGMYVPHFDGKGMAAEDFCKDVPTTKLLTTMYMESFINYGMGPSRQTEDGPYGITFPMGDSKLSLVSLRDIGRCACAILRDPTKIGTTQGITSEALTCEEVAATFEEVCGFPVKYNSVPRDVYASFGFPGAEDLANMFRFFQEFENHMLTSRHVDDDLLASIGGPTDKFEAWVRARRDAFIPPS